MASVQPSPAALCRDCLAYPLGTAPRCGMCGGPRLVCHPELFRLSTAHIDCDAFYAAVEKRDRPELADRAVIVGGGRRGVVATACYVARTFGVRSAMPMFKALKACPDAIVIPPDMAKYAAVARQVRTMLLAMSPAVEPISIDEAFVDLAGTERLHGAPPALTLARFQRDLERALGISVSVGLSHNKFLAKVASDLDKPRGFAVIGREETLSFLAERPISLIWGVGAVTQEKLARDGLTRIGQLQRMEERDLAARYGALGLRLARLARGEDARDLHPESEAKSVSAETTFDRDSGRAKDLLPELRLLSEKVSWRLKEQGISGRTVVLKLKDSGFRLRTRSRRLTEPSNLADQIFATGRELLLKELDGTSFRLIGIGVSGLRPAAEADASAQVDLMDGGAAKRAKAEGAMDKIRARYGNDGLALGLTFAAKRARRKPSA